MNCCKRTRPWLALIVVAATAPVTPGQATVRESAPAVPFTCFTSAWDGSFELLSTRYDREANRITWMLKAKKDTPAVAYEAFVVDPDGVEVDTIKVKFTPARKVKAGARVQADLSLGTTAGEPAKITIRASR